MTIERVITGPIEENCYVIISEKECIVIDPGDDGDKIAEVIGSRTVKYIALTHAHFDHIGALKYIKERFGGEIIMHKADLFLLENAPKTAAFFGLKCDPQPHPDRFVEDQDEIEFGEIKIKVIHVPGHSPGGVAYLFEKGKEKHLFTGDILFAGSVGRTDLPGGNWEQLITGIRRKLLTLDPATYVYPGHGPITTIAREMLTNPFLML